MLSDGVLTFYADVFCNGQKMDAKKELNAQHNKIRIKDAVQIAFFVGMIVISIVFFIFFLLYPEQSHHEKPWDMLSPASKPTSSRW